MAANATYLGVSALVTLLMPRFVTPFEFGLWQLYQLYALYLGYVTLGYSDGINLRMAGKARQSLSPRREASGFAYLFIIDALLFMAIAGVFAISAPEESAVLFGWAALGAIFYVPRTVITIIFQSTSSVRRYSMSLVVERVALGIGVVVLLSAGISTAAILVVADVVAKLIGLVTALWLAKDLILRTPVLVRNTWLLFVADCRAGLYVLAANIAAMLINGGVRLMIVGKWGTAVFGQVSLAFQFASLFMVAINSVAISLLPNVKPLPFAELGGAYLRLRRILVTPLVIGLPLCFPLISLLSWWLPDYSLAAHYTAMLFPLYIYESTNRGLTAVFMKALRMERRLLTVNVIALLVTIGIAGFGIYVAESLDIAVIAILSGLAVRAFLSESAVVPSLEISTAREWVLETSVVGSFLLCVMTGLQFFSITLLSLLIIVYAAVQYSSMRRSQELRGEDSSKGPREDTVPTEAG